MPMCKCIGDALIFNALLVCRCVRIRTAQVLYQHSQQVPATSLLLKVPLLCKTA